MHRPCTTRHTWLRALAVALSGVALVAACSSCDRVKPRTGNSSEPASNLTQVEGGARESRLKDATAEAQRRWPEFVAEFKKREKNTLYAVKLPFPVRGKSTHEHMWITVESINGRQIKGVLNNDPVENVGLKDGDPVQTTVDKIEDWLVVRGKDDMVGGFSIKVLEQIKKEQGQE